MLALLASSESSRYHPLMAGSEAPLAILRPARQGLADDARQVLKLALRRVRRVLRSDRADDDPTVGKVLKLALSPAVVAVAGLMERSEEERALALLRLVGESTTRQLDTPASLVLGDGDVQAEAPLDSPLVSLLDSQALDDVQGKAPRPTSARALVTQADLDASTRSLPVAPPLASPSPSLRPAAPASLQVPEGGGEGEGRGGGAKG